ncbi:hypothetical protein QBC35DRAFT_393683, partial [Podospora australis]
PNTPPVGVWVRGVGDITMPLSEVQARQLIEQSRQAPYGRGNETIVGTSVRDTWELDSSMFVCRDARWPAFLDGIKRSVAQAMGISIPIRAEIYKMLIYETGAMFKPHTDTEKIPGMFGSLVICLPSAHTGGTVLLKHCGQHKEFKTDGAPRSSWGCCQGRSHCLYHVLDHPYTKASIFVQYSENQRPAPGSILKDMTDDLPFEIFLALIEKKEQGECVYDSDGDRYSRHSNRESVHEFREIFTSNRRVETLLYLNGNEVMRNLKMNRRNFLQQNPFKKKGPEATHWYRAAALVLVPRYSVLKFLQDRCDHSKFTEEFDDSEFGSFDAVMKYYVQACASHYQASSALRNDFINLAQVAWRDFGPDPLGFDGDFDIEDGDTF